MIFNEIKSKERLLLIENEEITKKEIYIKPMLSCGNEILPKYKIDLADTLNGSLLGYIYFYVDIENYKSKFIGMEVDSHFRGKNYGSLLVSTYIQTCEQSHIDELTTTQKQIKPEVLHLLKKFGYVHNSDKYHNKVVILRKYGSLANFLYIPNSELRRTLEFSGLAEKNNYQFVDEITKDFFVLDIIYLNQCYRLSDYALCLRKQKEVNSHFVAL